MPEGPEVKRQADRVGRALEDQIALEVFFGLSKLADAGPSLSGVRVTGVQSRSKALLVHFEDGRSVYTHGQLYGRWKVVGADTHPRSNRQLRFMVRTERKKALLYSASEIEILDTDALDAHPYLSKLGPEALDTAVSEDALLERLESDRFHRRQLAALLLDQSFVAGLGNYLRSEILYFAGVLPEHRPADVSTAARRRLAHEVLEVTRRAYAMDGITMEEGDTTALKADGVPKRGRRHMVFGREGAPCRRCRTPVEKRRTGGRNIFVCSSCQT